MHKENIMKIIATSDSEHIGESFKYKNNVLTFEDETIIDILKVIENNYSFVYIAENYVIEAIEDIE
jgi:hypothetical protein